MILRLLQFKEIISIAGFLDDYHQAGTSDINASVSAGIGLTTARQQTSSSSLKVERLRLDMGVATKT